MLGQSESSARAELEARGFEVAVDRSAERRHPRRPRLRAEPVGRAPRRAQGSTVSDHDLDRAGSSSPSRTWSASSVRRPGDHPGRRLAPEHDLRGRDRPGQNNIVLRPESRRRLAGELRLDGDHRRRPPRLLGRAHRQAARSGAAGGRSSEHEISLESARSVIEGLDPDRYEVVAIEIPRDGPWLLDAERGREPRRRLPRPPRARSARTAPCRACSSSPASPTSARASPPRPSPWTRTSSSPSCATRASPWPGA